MCIGALVDIGCLQKLFAHCVQVSTIQIQFPCRSGYIVLSNIENSDMSIKKGLSALILHVTMLHDSCVDYGNITHHSHIKLNA